MGNPVMISSIFGPYLAIVGLWVLLSAKTLAKTWPNPKTSPGVFFLASGLNVLFGLIILSQYNMWQWNINLFVTLLGWVFILRGVLGLFIPEVVSSTTAKNPKVLRTFGIIVLIWGLILSRIAYFL